MMLYFIWSIHFQVNFLFARAILISFIQIDIQIMTNIQLSYAQNALQVSKVLLGIMRSAGRGPYVMFLVFKKMFVVNCDLCHCSLWVIQFLIMKRQPLMNFSPAWTVPFPCNHKDYFVVNGIMSENGLHQCNFILAMQILSSGKLMWLSPVP